MATESGRTVVLANARAGGPRREGLRARREELLRVMTEAGVDCEVLLVEPQELTPRAGHVAAAGARTVVAAGGDGTISAVAAALAGTGVPLGLLPAGTANHFAADLGVPADARAAARLIADHPVRNVDIGEVNGRVFINNISVGLYPRVVRQREEQRARAGRGRWLAMLLAVAGVTRRAPTVWVRVRSDAVEVVRSTPFLFVGNNEYSTALPEPGRRSALDAGVLSLLVAGPTSRLGLAGVAARGLLGRLDSARDLVITRAAALVVESPARRLLVAVDGEVVWMRPPLRCRVRPRELRVVAPPLAA